MAEQVNQRIEDMVNEFEQMRRTSLYTDEEIKELARKRKEFEYHIQRHVKQKEDYVQYISFELTLLEDISQRRKACNMSEKKKDIEFAIAKRLNKVFKQFICRFQNDVEVYFEYLKFCKSVGFNTAASKIVAQMLQMHGDKPKMWLLASKWEIEEQNNLEASRAYLLKGLQRHTNSEEMYLELFKAELLILMFNTETAEDRLTILKRADVVWRNGMRNIEDVSFLFKCMDLLLKYNVESEINGEIMKEIWVRKNKKEVWPYVAEKELDGCHWKEIEEFVKKDDKYPEVVSNCMGVYEEALTKFTDENLCTKYIHTLLGLTDSVCNEMLKISAVKQAWMAGYKTDLLTNDMFAFGIQLLKLEGETSEVEMWKLLDGATEKYSNLRCIWEEKLLLSKSDDVKIINILHEAVKTLNAEDAKYLYNMVLDNVESNETFKKLVEKFQNCEDAILLTIKPKLLQKMYDHNGLKAARDFYEELIRTPPIQLEVSTTMILIENLQDKPDVKRVRKCYEFAIVHHGPKDVDLWNDYIEFEIVSGDPVVAPDIYKRAWAVLDPKLTVKFIDKQIMHWSNTYK